MRNERADVCPGCPGPLGCLGWAPGMRGARERDSCIGPGWGLRIKPVRAPLITPIEGPRPILYTVSGHSEQHVSGTSTRRKGSRKITGDQDQTAVKAQGALFSFSNYRRNFKCIREGPSHVHRRTVPICARSSALIKPLSTVSRSLTARQPPPGKRTVS